MYNDSIFYDRDDEKEEKNVTCPKCLSRNTDAASQVLDLSVVDDTVPVRTQERRCLDCGETYYVEYK
jgi:ribosomal protein S27AE